jgi:hypothetical protein
METRHACLFNAVKEVLMLCFPRKSPSLKKCETAGEEPLLKRTTVSQLRAVQSRRQFRAIRADSEILIPFLWTNQTATNGNE